MGSSLKSCFIALLLFFVWGNHAQARHGGLRDGDESVGRGIGAQGSSIQLGRGVGEQGELQQGRQAQGAAGGGGGGGGGAQVGESPNRKKADEPKEIAKKAEENINKGLEKYSQAVEKLSQSFSSSLASLKPPEDDKSIMKNMAEDLNKRAEAAANAPTVGGEIVSEIVKGYKSSSDTMVATVQQLARALQPPPPSPPAFVQPKPTLGDKIKMFAGGSTTRSANALELADAATSPSAQIPSLPRAGSSGEPPSAVRGIASSNMASVEATVSAATGRGVAESFAANNFAVSTPAGGFSGSSVARGASAGTTTALSPDVPTPETSSRGEEPQEAPRTRRSNGRRAAASVQATLIPAIDSVIEPSSGESEEVDIAAQGSALESRPTQVSRQPDSRVAKPTGRGARESLLKTVAPRDGAPPTDP